MRNSRAMSATQPWRWPLPRAALWVVVPTVVAAVIGLVPSARAGWIALCFATAASVALIAALVRSRRIAAWQLLLLVAVAGIVAACLREVSPAPTPTETLASAAVRVEGQWKRWLDELDIAVSDPPPAGGDYGWVEERRRQLGPQAGLAVLSASGSRAHVWSGWTTPLTAAEQQALVERLRSPPAIIVLRRGLTLRLLYARRGADPGPLIVAAERPLPAEPNAGALASGLTPSIFARVRRQSIGEGVRAALGSDEEDASLDAAAMWSLVPLMDRVFQPAARVSLGAVSESQRRAARMARRRFASGLILAGLLGVLAFVGAGPWWGLIPARLALTAGCAAWGPLGAAHEAWGWLRGGEHNAPAALSGTVWHLFESPFDATLTGLTLVGLALLAPLPARRVGRIAMAAGAAGLALAGFFLTWSLTVAGAPAPEGALLGSLDGLPHRVSVALSLASVAWAGLLLLGRSRGWSETRALLTSGLLAGLLAGSLHGASLVDAAERAVESDLASRVAGREALWRRAVWDTLAIAVPPPEQEVLARDRDAIDLWWNSPLGRMGLASGVWKFAPGDDQEPEDVFLSGLPPVVPVPLLLSTAGETAGPYPRRTSVPRIETFRFMSGSLDLLLAEAQRPDGGSWVAAILRQPNNLPGRDRDDPLKWARALRSGASAPAPPGGLEPRLAWFDEAGTLLSSDVEASPPAPRAPPTEPRWRSVELEGRKARLYEMPDRIGTITAVLHPPDRLTRMAFAIGWALTLLLASLALALGRAVLARPAATMASFRALLAGLATQFRVQLAFALVVAGLLPLLVLGGAGRAAARQQAVRQLTAEGARAAQVARRLLEDYLAVEAGQAWGGDDPDSSDRVAAWLSRELGEDLFAWERGLLVGTSRPDLVRAGLWPERLPGHALQAIAVSRRPLLIDRTSLAVDPERSGTTVVHGPYRAAVGEVGVLSLPLAGAGRRFADSLAAVDRALLVSAALLVFLAALLLVPTARRFARPLAQLERATSQIAGGHFDAPVPETGYAETRALARAFREMADSLAAQQLSLERRRAAMEAVISSMPIAVIALTGERRVWAANPRARALIALDAGERLSDQTGQLPDAVRELAAARGEHTLDVEAGSEGETRRLRAAGIDLPGRAQSEPVRLIVIEDLTDAVRAERLVAWAEMARRVAHEIKNPLTPISLMVDHVRKLAATDDPRLVASLDRCLGTIADQVHVLKETAREFSDYARLLVARPEALDLPTSLRRWLDAYRAAPPAGVSIVLEGQDEMPSIQADPRLLRRAVVNLVDNA
ncbi:MAG: HAMP domain-containing protein, partial [Acidobacteriota bacterium]